MEPPDTVSMSGGVRGPGREAGPTQCAPGMARSALTGAIIFSPEKPEGGAVDQTSRTLCHDIRS